jgi:L-lactate transport
VTWSQTYLLFGHGLAVSATLAAMPIFTLLFLLGVMRKPAWAAGLSGLGVTLILATVGYRMPPHMALSAACDGAAFGLFPISWIVFGAIMLFRVTQETGQFEIIKNSIGRLTPDPRIQAILIAFAFGAFLEGAAGFGAPVAIASTMLAGLGFPAFRAAAICLLANTAPVAFGSIGIPVITLAGTTGLPLRQLSTDIGRLCTPVVFIMPMYLVVALWGFDALRGVWLPAFLVGAIFAAAQYVVSNYMGPQLTDILAALLAMASLIALLRFWHPKTSDTFTGADRITNKKSTTEEVANKPHIQESSTAPDSAGKVLYAWLPYILLVACVLLWGFKPVQHKLDSLTFTFPWPFLHDAVRRMPPIVTTPAPYHAIFNVNWLAASGTACMVATLLSAACARMSPRRFIRLLISVMHQLLLPTITVTSVLAVAFLMNYSGATATLGLTFAAAGAAFPFFSAVLGWLGVFLTGSDTASNALFGNLQVVTAGRLGLDPVLMAAANSVGGVMGKMISLQTIAVAAAATGISVADQARLFRFTLKHSILLVFLVGCSALLFAYCFA